MYVLLYTYIICIEVLGLLATARETMFTVLPHLVGLIELIK